MRESDRERERAVPYKTPAMQHWRKSSRFWVRVPVLSLSRYPT